MCFHPERLPPKLPPRISHHMGILFQELSTSLALEGTIVFVRLLSGATKIARKIIDVLFMLRFSEADRVIFQFTISVRSATRPALRQGKTLYRTRIYLSLWAFLQSSRPTRPRGPITGDRPFQANHCSLLNFLRPSPTWFSERLQRHSFTVGSSGSSIHELCPRFLSAAV